MITFIFSGQGSQTKGMGAELFDVYPSYTDKADRILGYSVKDLCLNDKNNQLCQTAFLQPAIYTVNALLFLNKMENGASIPDYLAGHSLGEYNALFAAGVFNFETGLKLVAKRGQLMGAISGGKMAAVLGITQDRIQTILKEEGLLTLSVANLNAPQQTVIAGPEKEIEAAQPLFLKAGAKLYRTLDVSGPFHTDYMKSAGKEFESFLNRFQYSEPAIPVISNAFACPYQNDQIVHNLVAQVSQPVKWIETIRYLAKKGPMQFEEIGPKNVLTNMVAGILENTEHPIQ